MGEDDYKGQDLKSILTLTCWCMLELHMVFQNLWNKTYLLLYPLLMESTIFLKRRNYIIIKETRHYIKKESLKSDVIWITIRTKLLDIFWWCVNFGEKYVVIKSLVRTKFDYGQISILEKNSSASGENRWGWKEFTGDDVSRFIWQSSFSQVICLWAD